MQHPTSDQSGFEQNMLVVELMVVLDEEVLLKGHNTQLEKDAFVWDSYECHSLNSKIFLTAWCAIVQ